MQALVLHSHNAENTWGKSVQKRWVVLLNYVHMYLKEKLLKIKPTNQNSDESTVQIASVNC